MIGFVFLSVLTSTPEWTVAAVSALRGVVEISVGDILGSNIVNISLVAGLAFLFSRRALTLTPSLAKSLGELLYLSALIPLVLLYFGTTSTLIGVLLTIFFIIYVALTYSSSNNVKPVVHAENIRAVYLFVVILVSAAMLIFSANFLVSAAKTIAELTGISRVEVGAKLVAVSTSAPELVTVAASMRRGESEMALGNAVGSNLTNVTLILGSLLALSGASIDLIPHIFTILFVIVVSMTFWFFTSRGKISLVHVAVLLALYATFLLIGK